MLLGTQLISLLAAVSSAVAININTPSPSSYWVQNTSNIIAWTFSAGDPNPIDITVTNPNSSFLNGPFSIAQFVDLSNGTFTVTNVTLVVASGYVVNFVDPSNVTNVFASSQPFQVMAPGTAPASQASPSATATSPSGTGASGTATGTSSGSSSTSKSGAGRMFSADSSIFPAVLGAGMALAGGLLAL